MAELVDTPVLELRPRFYRSGGKAIGDRTIWWSGVEWGFIAMKSHGPNGISYTFYDCVGRQIKDVHRSRYEDDGVYQTPTEIVRRHGDKSTVPLLELAKAKARELIEAGRMPDPAVIAAEREADRKRREDERTRNNELPWRLKLGYDHMIEMREIEAGLRAEGLTGIALHFKAIRQYETRHAGDPSYRQRQDAARARGEAWVLGASPPSSENDILIAALEAIRDGHNDPRALAAEILEKLRTA